jgi:hypothetical protein
MGATFFAHVQIDPGAHPASCTMGTGSFPEVKRPGRGADHPPPSSAEVEKGYSYTSIHPLGQFKPVMGVLYLFIFHVYEYALCTVVRDLLIYKHTFVYVTSLNKPEDGSHVA